MTYSAHWHSCIYRHLSGRARFRSFDATICGGLPDSTHCNLFKPYCHWPVLLFLSGRKRRVGYVVAIFTEAGHDYLPRGVRAVTILSRMWGRPHPNGRRLFAWCSGRFGSPHPHLSGKIELASLPYSWTTHANRLDLDAVRRISARTNPW